MLGHYQIGRELGKGATGVVYQGTDSRVGRVVAIKTLALSRKFECNDLEAVRARFFREAETAGRLAHPNIVAVFDAGEARDLAYIAMEFLKGKDLTSYIRADNLLPLDQLLSIVARVADALAYAHGRGVVHRDIKPANIMWEPEADTVKIADFGMAHIADSSTTTSATVLGTPSYMSPEQLAGRKIDGRSDLFSLGVSFYQLACGQLPFQGESMAQLSSRIASEPHRDIRIHRPGLPACVATIVNTAMTKDLDQRYQDGAQMAEALRACLGNLFLSAHQNPPRSAAAAN